ncbi:MAG: hypothetical protein WAV55_07475 [Clostridiaceae bacterium]
MIRIDWILPTTSLHQPEGMNKETLKPNKNSTKDKFGSGRNTAYSSEFIFLAVQVITQTESTSCIMNE